MTEAGKAFVERMSVVDAMVKGGAPIFPALAAGLEDADWMLVYVAARKLASNVRNQPQVTTPPQESASE